MKTLSYIAFIMFLTACNNSGSKQNQHLASTDTFHFRPLTEGEREIYKKAVYKKYDSILLRHQFNGGIIVAKNGEILLEDYHGYSDLRSKEAITANTPFHIASVSKTFTSMAIMKLWEEHKLSLDDSLNKYFPELQYPGITIRMLLSHRSGLPNYVYTMVLDPQWKHRLANNNDMLQFLIEKKPMRQNAPDRGFHYCNTNYAMLALIVEKVTGMPYPEYMSKTFFEPLGMKNTFVFTRNDSANYHPSYQYNNRPFALEPMDAIYGDKNIYSTPRDLLLWDKAIYNNALVSKATYDEATKPTSFEKKGVKNYGLGWRLVELPNHLRIIFHNGWWHGNNAVFNRFIDDTATIIVLGNKYNKAIYAAAKIGTIFNNTSCTGVDNIGTMDDLSSDSGKTGQLGSR